MAHHHKPVRQTIRDFLYQSLKSLAFCSGRVSKEKILNIFVKDCDNYIENTERGVTLKIQKNPIPAQIVQNILLTHERIKTLVQNDYTNVLQLWTNALIVGYSKGRKLLCTCGTIVNDQHWTSCTNLQTMYNAKYSQTNFCNLNQKANRLKDLMLSQLQISLNLQKMLANLNSELATVKTNLLQMLYQKAALQVGTNSPDRRDSQPITN